MHRKIFITGLERFVLDCVFWLYSSNPKKYKSQEKIIMKENQRKRRYKLCCTRDRKY